MSRVSESLQVGDHLYWANRSLSETVWYPNDVRLPKLKPMSSGWLAYYMDFSCQAPTNVEAVEAALKAKGRSKASPAWQVTVHLTEAATTQTCLVLNQFEALAVLRRAVDEFLVNLANRPDVPHDSIQEGPDLGGSIRQIAYFQSTSGDQGYWRRANFKAVPTSQQILTEEGSDPGFSLLPPGSPAHRDTDAPPAL